VSCAGSIKEVELEDKKTKTRRGSLKEKSESNVQTLEEGGPLSKLLKAQEETNKLLGRFLKENEEEEEGEEKVEKAKMKKQEPMLPEGLKPEDEKKPKDGVEKAMEQTNQGAPKKVVGTQPGKPWEAEVMNQEEGEEDDKEKEKPYPYPYPEEQKAIKKAFPFPYGNIGSKREEVVAKALELANQEINRLNNQLTKMIPAAKVEEMVNARFQQKMQEEGFVPASGALPANVEKALPAEIRKSADGSDEVTEAEGIVKNVIGLDWENLIAMRRNIDPAYNSFLGARHGLPLKGGI
jgi:hypothetical protein